MPHLNFQTPINGFYEDILKNDPRNRVILYAKISSNADFNFDFHALENKESFDKLADSYRNSLKNYTNNFYPIGITSLENPISISTQYNWENGGNIFEHMITQFQQGVQGAKSSLVNLFNTINTGAKAIGLKGFMDEAKTNILKRKYFRNQINAADSFKRYNGSATSIQIPPLEFTFAAEDFLGSHLSKAFGLLSYLLPLTYFDTDSKVSDKDLGVNTDHIDPDKYWMWEEAPNGYVNPYAGFDSSFTEGTFAINFGGNVVKELIPTSITLTQSKTKVLSEYDYRYVASNLKKYIDIVEASTDIKYSPASTGPAKYFYDKYQITYDKLTRCQDSVYVPSVVRIQVSFDFAKKIVANDYLETFFTYDRFELKAPSKNINPRINKLFEKIDKSVSNSGHLQTRSRS